MGLVSVRTSGLLPFQFLSESDSHRLRIGALRQRMLLDFLSAAMRYV